MAVTINEDSVAAIAVSAGVRRQPLMTTANNTSVIVDRLLLAAGASHILKIAAGNLAWFQVLDGAATLTHVGGTLELTEAHVAFVPPSFTGTLTSMQGATLLRRKCASSIGHKSRCSTPNTTRANAFTWSRPNFLARTQSRAR